MTNINLSTASRYILLSIYKNNKHGYAIAKEVNELTNNKVTLSNGTLYGALARLEEQGLINQFHNNDVKSYEITEKGIEVLLNEYKELKEQVLLFSTIVKED